MNRELTKIYHITLPAIVADDKSSCEIPQFLKFTSEDNTEGLSPSDACYLYASYKIEDLLYKGKKLEEIIDLKIATDILNPEYILTLYYEDKHVELMQFEIKVFDITNESEPENEN